MMTQEEFMDVLAMKRQGMSLKEIGDELGYHPATIAKWVKAGGPPAARSVTEAERAADAASVPIETGPGEEAQFDWSDCSGWADEVGLAPTLWCFGMILCWSRWRLWWFSTSVDREHTFEGVVRFFEAAGGVPKLARTDRMGALGLSQGRRFVLHAPTLEFARHHGTEIKACQAGDAKRKGKVERPFRDLKESFLQELVVTGVPDSIDELNDRAQRWVTARVHDRPHRSTGVAPATRMEAERWFLSGLPARRFDTDYVETRRVHRALPFVAWEGVRYSVPPACLGQTVEARVAVDGSELTVRWAGKLVARHRLATAGVSEVWDPGHRLSAETAALASNRRRHLHVIEAPPGLVVPASRIELGAGDFDVAVPDLRLY